MQHLHLHPCNHWVVRAYTSQGIYFGFIYVNTFPQATIASSRKYIISHTFWISPIRKHDRIPGRKRRYTLQTLPRWHATILGWKSWKSCELGSNHLPNPANCLVAARNTFFSFFASCIQPLFDCHQTVTTAVFYWSQEHFVTTLFPSEFRVQVSYVSKHSALLHQQQIVLTISYLPKENTRICPPRNLVTWSSPRSSWYSPKYVVRQNNNEWIHSAITVIN